MSDNHLYSFEVVLNEFTLSFAKHSSLVLVASTPSYGFLQDSAISFLIRWKAHVILPISFQDRRLHNQWYQILTELPSSIMKL